jgi:hypothetical protein
MIDELALINEEIKETKEIIEVYEGFQKKLHQ